MEPPESTSKTPNDDETTKSNNENQSVEKIQCSEEVPTGDDVKTKGEVNAKIKRVSFHFGTSLSANREESVRGSNDITLNTIQNIYESKSVESNLEDDANLVQNNSTRSRINKSAYIKLHRHSFSSTGNSSVDKLKGKYENITKQADNNSKVNIVTRAKANIDNDSTNNEKNSISTDKQGKKSDLNSKEKTNALKAEFINSQPIPTGKNSKSSVIESTDSYQIQESSTSFTEETKKDTNEKPENLLQKTTSNIEKLQNNLSTKLSNDTIERLRNKYSPASFGYPRNITALKTQKKVQFSEESLSKIPVPTPRVSVKPPNAEGEKSESNIVTPDTSDVSKQATDEDTNKEQIQAVTIKLISVPETVEQNNTKQQIDLQVSEDTPKVKDENFNVVDDVDNKTPLKKERPKEKPPILTTKPNIPKIIVQESPTKSPKLPDNFQIKGDYLEEITGIEVEVSYDNIEFAEPEDKHFIVRHSSSEDSIDKVENFFSTEIIMDKKSKDKKRSNSFKKILTGGLFGRDKKKNEEDKTKHKKKDNAVFADNAQNESQAFDRNSTHRHTIDNSYPRREVQKNTFQSSPSSGPLYYYSPQAQYRRTSDDANFQNRYTEMKGSNGASFVSNRHPKYSPEEYVPMDSGNPDRISEGNQTNYMNVSKYIDTSSSSSNTLESENRNCTYQNALIAQAEMRQIRENEHMQKNVQRSGIPVNLNRRRPSCPQENRFTDLNKHSGSPEMFRDGPLYDQDSSKNVQLVKPKALIPINSERPLPNPYHNNQDKVDNSGNYQNVDSSKTLDRNLNLDNSKPVPHKNNLYTRADDKSNKPNSSVVVVEDVYGTVFDSISSENSHQINQEYLRTRSLSPQQSQRSSSNCSSPSGRNPTSPRSLEASKLKLPPNREKVELQPRIRSPIPQAKISTDKIIATELLRNKRSPTNSSPVLRTEAREKSPTKLQRSPQVSPTRPASYQGMNVYENSSSLQRDGRSVAFPKGTNLTRDLPNVAHSTPQNISQNAPNEYMYLNTLTPIPKNKPPVSPREISATECFQAAEWQRKQKELDKSPALEKSQQITTDVMVHVNPEDGFVRETNYGPVSPVIRQRTPSYQHIYHSQGQPPSPRSLNSSMGNVRAHTPVQQRIPSPLPKSPEKQHMLQSVEAFYWREIKKLKEREDQDLLNYRQHQLNVYGYVEDPVYTRRSRSVSPSMQRGRRSLSLPRDVRPMPVTGRGQLISPEPIPEGRPVIAKQPISLPTESSYGQVRPPLQRNPNFIRNNFERSTIGPIGMSKNSKLLYENYYPDIDGPRRSRQQAYAPIFKRGSLTGNIGTPESQLQMSKKVSFSSTQTPSSWPTKNGFTKSPPTRRVEREVSMEDDVFLPNSPRMPPNRQPIEMYSRNQVEPEPPYVLKQEQMRKGRVREADYPSRAPKSEVDYVNRNFQEVRQGNEPMYGRTGSKQVTVSNKVCDIYGQIHDSRQRSAMLSQNYGQIQNSTQVAPTAQNYGQVRQMGLIYGHLQPNSKVNSPMMLRQSYNQLSSPPGSFVRGTRLTASVNDMYKRYPIENPRYQIDPRYQGDAIYANERTTEAPYRPLPPLPERKDSRLVSNRKMARGYVPVSDTESGSEAGEVQRILQSGTKQKHFSVIEEEWNSDGKSGRASGNESGGSRGENEGEIKSGRSRSARREDPRRHTLSGDQHYSMAGQGGPLSRTMDLEGQFPRGYPPSSNAMLFDDDPGIMSEVETSSTGFRRGGKQRSSLPVVRTPSKTLERPLVFLQYRNETKRALLPNEITSIDTVKALFVRSFPKQLSMEYLDSPLVKIYIHDSSKDMFYELEDVRSHLREIRDRSVLRLFESTDVSGGLPMGGVGIPGGIGHFEDPSYFSEPEFDSEYQHQHIHKSKGSAGKGAPYYMGSTTSLPRGGPLLRPYSPAVGALPPDRLKTLPAGSAPPKPQRAYSSGATRASDGSSRPPDRFAPFQRPANPLFNLPDGYMSSPERGSRGYEDPYYSQYTSRSGSITPVIDEEVSDTELLDEQYSLYGVKLAPGGPRAVRAQFPGPAAPPYDTTRLRVEHMERQLANLTGLVQKALTQTPTPRDFLAPPGRDAYRSDKSVSFEKSVSFSDEPPDMNSPKQHSPQHAEKDRLKPAPPPKPASLSPGQYDGRHIYRDLQLTPEMYNQLRGLQKKAKDLRAEVRNLRRMSQAQAHSVRETIRDTFIKIRAMLMAGGEQVWQAGMDQERVRLSRDEDLYKQEMLRLEKDLTDLEASVEELRGNVINRKTRVNMSDVENMALVLSKSSKTVADLKLRFPGLQDSMKAFLSSEMDKVVREEKFLKEEPERLESALRRCKKLTGTLVTLKRLASVQEQRLPCSTSAADGRISPSSITETPPITPTSGQHSKPPSGARMGQVGFGGDSANATDSNQRPENALDALLDELQTFSKPHPATVNTQMPQASYSDSTPSDPPAIPIKGIPPSHSAHFGHPHMSEIGRKGSMDSAAILPTQNLTVSTATGSLRRLHSYPSGSDTDNSPPIQPLRTQMDGKTFNKPPIPERNAELLQHIASGRRVPPPPPPRTSSKSPLASPTSPSLPPRSPATGLQHIQNVQNMTEKPQSQFEAATQNLGLSTLRRNVPNRSSMKDNKAQTLPRNIGSNLQIHTQIVAGSELQNVSSSSCESVNSQDGTKKGSRKEELEQRHQELLKKQKALQEQYARLQQLQRGNNTLAVVPPAPDQLLKKTGSESNLLQKMGLQMATTQMTGSLTHLPGTTTTSTTGNNVTNTAINTSTTSQPPNTTAADTSATDNSSSSSTTTTSKVYETDIL